ncbi:MAG: pyridoxal-phosphate dependent enzyme [Gammaproteobacteria bacterium]|nr:pyridoxal-phosphate dependent enzyme [Gammaproteobacteria bacterium]
MSDSLATCFPALAERLQKVPIADLPTPVSTVTSETPAGRRSIWVKHDNVSSELYGGNKVRKLEYLLQRARGRGARRIATFGAVGSNHALATAMFSSRAGLDCTCFLGHQNRTPYVSETLNMHRRIGTEIVPLGSGSSRLATLRKYLHGRRCWVIPLGGSSWLGAVGFVNAGLELAAQVSAGELPAPERIYIANGTMGSAAGLAIGLALAEAPGEVQAIRVVDERIANPVRLRRLLEKTALMLRRIDPFLPADLADRARIRLRDEFFAGGYAAADAATRDAVAVAARSFDLKLETTYTGKAMAALLHDLQAAEYAGERCLFWNTYSSRALPVTAERPATPGNIPPDFMRYYD